MKYDIIESNFQQKNTSAYQLSILVGMDSLVYSVFDVDSKQLLLIKTLEMPTKGAQGVAAVLASEPLLDLLYRRVKISVPEKRTALVPSRLFNESEAKTYLDELSSNENVKVSNDELKGLSAHVVYQLDDDMSKVLKRKFPTARIYSSMTPFLMGSSKLLPQEQEHAIFAHFYNDLLHLAVFEKGNLTFCNAFSYTSASDVLYYILLAYEQFKLDPQKVQLFLSGKVVKDSEIYKMLYRYIAEIDFVPKPDFIHLGRKFSSVPEHLFFHLHSLALCK